MLFFALLPPDGIVCVLAMLDVRDLVWLRAAAPAVFDRAIHDAPFFTYAAHRVLSQDELRWFGRHRVPVALLVVVSDQNEGVRWLQNGVLHRDGDLPANDKKHRDGDQPAEINDDGTRYWCRDGKLHRDGGQPAVILADGSQKWYHKGVQYCTAAATGPRPY